jgi:hypothetical protein
VGVELGIRYLLKTHCQINRLMGLLLYMAELFSLGGTVEVEAFGVPA